MANETKKFASLENLQTFKTNLDNRYATQAIINELSTDVAYINVEDNENIENADISATSITIDSALSETSTNPVQNKVITSKLNQLSSEKVDKSDISLGIASDGLIYIFVNGVPVGTGIPQGQSGDVFGYVDENNTIVLNGNLADGSYSVKYEMENGDIVDIGNMVLDSNVYYSVTSDLTNCTNSNSTKTVVQGGSYSATISANSGYELKSVVVTMGGAAVSVTNGVINIASVTGDIVITAVAEEAAGTEEEIINQIPLSTDTDGSIFDDLGYRLNSRIRGTGEVGSTSGYSCTGFIPVKTGDKLYMSGMYVADDSGNSRIALYRTDKSFVRGDIYPAAYVNEGNNIYSHTITDTDVAFVRISVGLIMTGDEIVTINQPITSGVVNFTNFAEYNATNTTDYSIWVNNTKINTDGTFASDADVAGSGTPAVSNYISVQNGDVIEYTGIYSYAKFSAIYDSNKTIIYANPLLNMEEADYITNLGQYSAAYRGWFTINSSDIAYVRIGGYIGSQLSVSIRIKRNGEYL